MSSTEIKVKFDYVYVMTFLCYFSFQFIKFFAEPIKGPPGATKIVYQYKHAHNVILM